VPAPDDGPGVGPVVALTYRATVDVPVRSPKSKAVGALFGLTCSKYQSGERQNIALRRRDDTGQLYEAAQSIVRSNKWSWLTAWTLQIVIRRWMKNARSWAWHAGWL
jgi:transposase